MNTLFDSICSTYVQTATLCTILLYPLRIPRLDDVSLEIFMVKISCKNCTVIVQSS